MSTAEDDWQTESHEWDSDVLEPVAQISQEPVVQVPQEPSPRRGGKRRHGGLGFTRKKRRSAAVLPDAAKRKAVIADVSIKEEPSDALVEIPASSSDGMTSSARPEVPPHPMFQVPTAVIPMYVAPPQSSLVQPTPSFPAAAANSSSLYSSPSHQDSGNIITESSGLSIVEHQVNPVKDNLETKIKQEVSESEHVVVLPFTGINANREQTCVNLNETVSAPSLQPVETNNDSGVRDKDKSNQHTGVVSPGISQSGGQSSTTCHKDLKELTQLLLELNNKNLDCDQKIQKLKEEYEQKVAVIESVKKANEKEIDRVLSLIQNWKEETNSAKSVSSEVITRSRKKNG